MRVVVAGAGLAGLMAGRSLASAGHDVVLLDKGRSPGGRLATRRVGGATLDHGAQFFTVRTDRFDSFVEEWRREGLVREWCRGFTLEGDGYPRYVVRGGMNALAKHLARGLDVRCGTLVFAVRPGARPATWAVALDDGTALEADALIVTFPLPQAFAVLVSSGIELPSELTGAEYDRTISLMVALDRPGLVPPPGGRQDPDDTFSFIGDNEVKGVSARPAITFHANATWSESRWDDDRATVHADLLAAAGPWLGDATVMADSVKRWRFATPRTIWPDPCWEPDGGAHAPVVLAGDAFAGPRMEGAALSGLAAADRLR